MKVLAADGLSFSVPIDSVSKIIEHFKRNGYVLDFSTVIVLPELNDKSDELLASHASLSLSHTHTYTQRTANELSFAKLEFGSFAKRAKL